jgi:hypothetical protein
MGRKTGMGGAVAQEVVSRLTQAEVAIYGTASKVRILVVLTVVFPPADRAQAIGLRGLERSVPTAGTAYCGRSFHNSRDVNSREQVAAFCRKGYISQNEPETHSRRSACRVGKPE